MARINIEEVWWSDSRRNKLIRLFKGDARLADGLMVQAWRQAQEFSHKGFLIPFLQFLCLEDAHFLFECELAEVRLTTITEVENTAIVQANSKHCLDQWHQRLDVCQRYLVYLKGSENHLAWLVEKRMIASSGGKKSAQRPRDARGRLLPKVQAVSKQCLDNSPSESNDLQPSSSLSLSLSSSLSSSSSLGLKSKNIKPEGSPPKLSTQIWQVYSQGIEAKYHGTPERNAKTNSQIVSLLKQVPEKEAIPLVEFYLRHPNSYYASQMHQIGPMLQDAGKLLLEMRSGQLAPDRNLQNGKASNGKWLTHDEKKRQNTISAVQELCAEISGGDFDG